MVFDTARTSPFSAFNAVLKSRIVVAVLHAKDCLSGNFATSSSTITGKPFLTLPITVLLPFGIPAALLRVFPIRIFLSYLFSL